jgi:hypothetical protein
MHGTRGSAGLFRSSWVRLPELAEEPGLCRFPVPHDRLRRHVQYIRCLFDAEAAKEPQLDDLAHTGVERRQRAQRITEGDKGGLLRLRQLSDVIDNDPSCTAASFLPVPAAGKFDYLPFSGSTREELMETILRAAPESMTGLNPDVPSELERITFKCLEKSADDRYQSARALLSDLWPLKRQLDATREMVDSPWFEFLRRPVETAADESPGSEACELVARGWAHLRSGSFFELSDAVSAFVAATEVAPAYAAAHAGLALTKVAQAVAHDVPHLEALAEARTIALRALALNDKSRWGVPLKRETSTRPCGRYCDRKECAKLLIRDARNQRESRRSKEPLTSASASACSGF